MEDNIITFATDDQFIDFCLSPDPVVYKNENTGVVYYDYPFTQQYLDAINNGTMFNITANKSLVKKRGCVYRGIITKPVENLN